jgi:hypothetical protein
MLKKIVAMLCGVSVLGAVLLVAPLKTESAPVVAIIATIATVTTAVLVYDYNSCDIHIIWGCGDNGGGSGGSGKGGSGGSGTNNNNVDGVVPGNQNNNGAGGGGAGQACSSAPNACGMTGTGFTDSQGVCAASIPPVSSCPTPVFGEFSAEPSLVRKGDTATLSWEVSDATACSISGGGLNLLNLSLDGSQETNSIENRTEFTLTCFNGDAAQGAPSTSETIVVNLVPTYQEQ